MRGPLFNPLHGHSDGLFGPVLMGASTEWGLLVAGLFGAKWGHGGLGEGLAGAEFQAVGKRG